MQLINIVQAALLTAYIHAAPVSESEAPALVLDSEAPALNDTSVLLKRVPFAAVRCGGGTNVHDYTNGAVGSAFGNLERADQANPKPAAGGRTYPRQLGRRSEPPTDPLVLDALNRIPECSDAQTGSHKWFEFPLVDPPWYGGEQESQGPDRVVAIAPNIGPGGVRQFTYCLAVTHRTASPKGAFIPCDTLAADA